ncbi:MAG: dethiobiotin synthase [Pseudomonadota bacterium]
MSITFITATGTDIGKTFLTAGMIRYFRDGKIAVEALKPVATGFDDDAPEWSDTAVLLGALGRRTTPEEINRISPFRFAAPLAPDMAAARERRKLDFDELLEFTRRAALNHQGQLLIEGVGGIMVPLDDRRTVLDWMMAINRPIVLVTGSYLGTISHTLTCLDVLIRRGLEVRALVVNETPASTVPLSDTVDTMRRFARDVPVFAMPRLAPGITEHPTFGRVCETLLKA